MKKLYWLVFLTVLLSSPLFVSAATWSAEDNFDSYTTSTTLNGANGGSGWSGAWVTNSGSTTSDTAPSGGQGGLALYQGGSASVSRTRSTTGADGYVHFKVRISNSTYSGIYFTDSGGGGVNANRFGINLNNPSGWITATDGQSYNTNLTPLSINTWYDITIKYGHVAGQYAVSINGGAYSANQNMGGGNNSLIDGITVFSDIGTTDLWVDDITDAYTPPPAVDPSITGSGTINRLAKFTSSTTTIGDALFSDDGVNTTLTAGNLFFPVGSHIDSSSTGTLNFGTATTTTMTFGRSGQNMIINSNVGIGTSSPSTKLYVNGDIFGNWLKIAADSFGLDTLTSGVLYIGSSTANAIKIGRTGITTTINGTTSAIILTATSANISGTLSANTTTLTSLTSITTSAGILSAGTTTVAALKTVANCNSSASPAICGSASSGSVAMATGGSTLVVNTTAVTPNSQILITEDSSLGARLGITCNTTTGRVYTINARATSTSFTIKSSANPTTNKACLSYWIIN